MAYSWRLGCWLASGFGLESGLGVGACGARTMGSCETVHQHTAPARSGLIDPTKHRSKKLEHPCRSPELVLGLGSGLRLGIGLCPSRACDSGRARASGTGSGGSNGGVSGKGEPWGQELHQELPESARNGRSQKGVRHSVVSGVTWGRMAAPRRRGATVRVTLAEGLAPVTDGVAGRPL